MALRDVLVAIFEPPFAPLGAKTAFLMANEYRSAHYGTPIGGSRNSRFANSISDIKQVYLIERDKSSEFLWDLCGCANILDSRCLIGDYRLPVKE